MNEQEVLAAIEKGESAYSLLMEANPKYRERWERLCSSINKFLADVQKDFPDANYYTGGGGFNLLLAASHDSRHRPQSGCVALNSDVKIGDGDW